MQTETTELAIRTVRNLYELEVLRATWKAWPGTRDSDFDFFSALVKSRGSDCRPHVIVLSRNEKPHAMLVGLEERKKLCFRIGWLTLCEPEVNILQFVPGALRGNASQENCAAFVQEAMRALREGEADLVLWEQLDVQSALRKYALQWWPFALRDHFHCIDHHWWLKKIPESLNAFLMSRSGSQRTKLRRKYKKVVASFPGKVRVRCFRYLEDLEPAIADMEEIASKTDKRRVFGVGFFDNPYVRELIAVAAERGWLRIYILYLRGEPVAFWRCTVYDGCLQGDHSGYDPAWREFSPGIFLFLNILDHFGENDIKSIDFGYGDTQFKRYLGDLHALESRLCIYAPTPRGMLFNLLNMATICATDWAKLALRYAGCWEWGKKTSRNRLANKRRPKNSSIVNPVGFHDRVKNTAKVL